MARPDNPEKTIPQSEKQSKTYRAPELVEYGDIQDITRGDSGAVDDAPGTRKDTF
jgi:hypothetical protein